MPARAADRARMPPIPSLAEGVVLMSTYEEFMIILLLSLLVKMWMLKLFLED